MSAQILTANQYHQEEAILSLEQQQQRQEQQQQQFSTFIGNIIGSGKTSDVYICSINNQNYALKNYKEQHMKFYKNEVSALSQLNHPNIVRYFGQASESSILLEYCQNGEVFDFIQQAQGNFPKELAMFYSMQLSHAIAFMHSINLAHLDIKLENCLFDNDYNLKLADFGFSAESSEKIKENRFIGTHRYMAPEIENCIEYNSKKADIFALGCVIFILELGFQPIYTKATQDDKYYSYFAYNNQNIFWKWIEKSYKRELNSNFKDLINKMLCYNPKQRISIEQVLSHPYFQGLALDKDARKIYMEDIKNQIIQNKQQEQQK